ncbi:hypothetical protein TgHK011_007309 [Trichoderma gracile]|nr:hypothetical protein TgHK011_007309 [Trichoderma gracile]
MDASSSSAAASSSSFSSSTYSSTTRQSPSTSAAVMAPAAPVQAKVPSTEPFLKDFTLVAEAAKRAQAAVMVRDFADMGL